MATAAEVFPDLYALVDERGNDYDLYYDYYDGAQDLPVRSSQFTSKFGTFFSTFRDNLARPIIDTAENRVRVVEFGTGQGLGADALDIWERNRLKVESTWVHKEAMVKGDGYVIVLEDENGDAGIWPQITDSIAILYDEVDPRKKVAALKWWAVEITPEGSGTAQNYVRINLYFEDRIERYITTQQTDAMPDDFSKYEAYGDEGAIVSKHKVGEVPVFQFSANYDINTSHGRSDLVDAAPLIDAVNKTFLDMLVSSEYTAAPQRWATGVEIPLDPKTGEPIKAYEAGADRLWTAPNEQARFGQFASGDLTSYREGIKALVEHLAFVTRTPTYTLGKEANLPSGEMLKAAEGPLRQRVQDHDDAFGGTWTDVMAAAFKVDGIDFEDDERADFAPRFLPVNAPFATSEFLEELKIKGEVLGVPEEMLWREAGYTAKEIEEMKTMREEQAQVGIDAAATVQSEAILGGAPPATPQPGGVADDTLGLPAAPAIPEVS